MKGETMVMRAYLVAIFLGVSVGQAANPQAQTGPNVLLSAHHGLVDVDSVAVVLAAPGPGLEVPPVDLVQLKTRVIEMLSPAGIRHVESQTPLAPRLVVRMEGLAIPDCDKCIWRAQIALTRGVTLPGWPDSQLQAEVWQAQPVMQVVGRQEAAGVISAAVLAQVEAFVAACQAARSPLSAVPDAKQNPVAPTVAGSAFVCSKSSQVFHRPDCRWVQSIAADNLIGYKSRDEAVQAGKRPCKTCQP